MYLIVGLGNPTRKYEKTRHNIGFDVMDALAEKYDIEMNQKKEKAICGTGYMEGQKVLLAKPQTFMNLSGESIQEAVRFSGADPETEFLVVYDDVSLPPGQLRIRYHTGLSHLLGRNFLDIDRPGCSVNSPVGHGFSRTAVRLGKIHHAVTDLTDPHCNDSADNTQGISAKSVAFIR